MKKFIPISVFFAFLSLNVTAYAENIETNTARMQAMDKITGRVSMINVPINGEVEFGSLSIVVRSCQTRPAEEAPDNFAFVDITDTSNKGETQNVFKGWMISSSPATHALEHPIYDVWLLQCVDTENKNAKLLSEKQLAERDELPMLKQAPIQHSPAEALEHNISETQNQIAEMTAEERPETSQPEMLLPTEFSFDEEEISVDDETSDMITDDTNISDGLNENSQESKIPELDNQADNSEQSVENNP